MTRGDWAPLRRGAPGAVSVDGVEIRPGSRVRLAPRPGADIMDIVLAGRVAVVEAVEQDVDGAIKLAVVVEDDPGRDLGFARSIAHRFFFDVSEVVALREEAVPAAHPAPAPAAAGSARRILVAGIGNIFLGDDGFGVRLAHRLAAEPLRDEVEVRDYGIRGLDLAFAMQDGYDAVVMLDASPRGQAPGTLYVIEVDASEGEPTLDAHGMHPLAVIALVRACGQAPPATYVVGCEPSVLVDAEADDIVGELSPAVGGAIEPAVALVRSLLDDLLAPIPDQEALTR